MNNRAIEAGVGLFVAIGLAALAWLAISVSGLDFSESGDEYQVEARFSNIAGLKPAPKSPVPG